VRACSISCTTSGSRALPVPEHLRLSDPQPAGAAAALAGAAPRLADRPAPARHPDYVLDRNDLRLVVAVAPPPRKPSSAG
jgi:hypothetical protein